MQQPVFLLRLQETKSTIAQAKYAATLSSGAEAEVHMKKSKLKGTKTIDTPTEAQHFLYEGGTLPSPKERRSCAFLRSWDAVGGKTKQNVLVYSEDKNTGLLLQ